MEKLIQSSRMIVFLVLSSPLIIHAQKEVIPDQGSLKPCNGKAERPYNSFEEVSGLASGSESETGLMAINNVNQYVFTQSAGTYLPVNGGTLVGSSSPGSAENYLDDLNFSSQPISFAFVFNGISYTSYNINTNGHISFGSVIPAPGTFSPISSNTAYEGAISAFGRDLDGRFAFQANTTAGSNVLTSVSHFGGIVVGKQVTGSGIPSGATIASFNQSASTITLSANATATANSLSCIAYTAEIRRITLGTAPNRIHVVQFRNFKRNGPSAFGEVYNFQFRLHETTNLIEIVYGTHVGFASSTSGQVGLRGASNTDFRNRTTSTNWSATTAGLTNTAACSMSSTVFPTAGLTFVFTPPSPCTTPGNQPTNLVVTPSLTSISGSFTGATGSDGYLVVRSLNASLNTLPADGTTYISGGAIGNGTVVYSGINTSFNATGLTSSTNYFFYVFSMNALCTGGPKYLTVAPLTGSATTLPNPPTAFTANAAGQTQINLSATPNAAGNHIFVVWNTLNVFGTPSGTYGLNDSVAGGGTVYYIGPAASLTHHTGLNPGTTHYYRAWSVVSGPGYSSTAINANASTVCDTVSFFPYTEDFNSAVFPPTACWERYSGYLANPSILTPVPFGWVHDDWRNLVTGDKAAKVNVYGEFVNYWFVTPSIDLGTGGYQLEFDLCLVKWNTADPPDLNGTDDRLAVVISPDNGVTWSSANTLRMWNNTGSPFVYNNINPLGQQVIIDIGSYTGVVRVGFYAESTVLNADNDLMINNVKIWMPPACPEPANLTTSNVSLFEVKVNWNDANQINNYLIVWGLQGFDPDNPVTYTGSFLKTYPFQPGSYFHNISGLSAGTSYDVYIRADCGAGGVSEWSGPASFTTTCPKYPFPFTESFGGSAIPLCWNQTFSGSISSSVWNLSSTSMAGGSMNEMRASGTNGAGISRLITPSIDLSGSPAVLRFKHFYSDKGTQATKATLRIQSSSNGVNWTNESWSLLSGNGNAGPETVFVNITQNTGSDVYIAWVIDGNHADITKWYMDDVVVWIPPANDVATLSVDLPGAVNAGTILPQATIANLGSNTANFNVQMTIGSYSSVAIVNALAPLMQVQVAFDPWIPAEGDYTAQVCTQWAVDTDPSNNCLSKPVKVLDLNKDVYGYIAFPGTGSNPIGPMTFNLSDPGSLTSLGNQGILNYISGGTWANGTWYGTVNKSSAPYNFISIDTTTGFRTIIGNMGVNMSGLSFNPANGLMYSVGYDGTGHSKLYTINLNTGAATLVGNCGPSMLISLAINNAGQAYSVDLASDMLGTVDLVSGLFTAIGPTGFNANGAQDMEFDRENNQLYLTAYDYSGWLGWVDPNTGYVRKIESFEGGARVTGFAIPWTGSLRVSLKVFLEGPYDAASNKMNTDLLDKGLVPVQQPYNPPLPYYGNMSPDWLHVGTESVVTFPPGVVDWVIVQLRDAPSAATATPATIIGTQAAFLLNSGFVVGLDGESNLFFPAELNDDLFVVVYHRNHLGIMSASGLTQTAGVFTYDFRTDVTKVYQGAAGYKQINTSPVVWGMVAADGDADGMISPGDKITLWSPLAGEQGYFPSDYDLDSQVDNNDKNTLWRINYLNGYSSQVPE